MVPAPSASSSPSASSLSPSSSAVVAAPSGAVSSFTVDRSLFRLVQTPQTFQLPLLLRAYEQPFRDTFTDDASVVEALGHPITLVEGNRENIKITTPFDLTIAEALLHRQP
ncbi:MAG: 2-C-methyl-D-erythritol 4-phosphate cytidylyltransferase [Bacteroidaceae bacterium]|nr:2-C-methyl-D-erythritol 4-phosphate cytidylyltransferase [Bacteroidaceae bacterium]